MDAAKAEALVAVFDMVRKPAAIVSSDGRLIAANSVAQAELSSEVFLRARSGLMEAVDSASSQRLKSALRDVSAPETHPPKPPVAVVLQGRHGEALIADVAPLAPRDATDRAPGTALVVLPIRRGGDVMSQALRRAYGLTPSEAEVALALLQGQGLDEIAALRGVLQDTIRSQLKAIYRKTGAANQAMLVAAAGGMVGLAFSDRRRRK